MDLLAPIAEPSTIQGRIKFIAAKFFNGNITAMARTVLVSQTTLRDIVGERESKPSYDTLTNIIKAKELDINPEWLLTGLGDMQKSKFEQEVDDTDRSEKGSPYFSDLPVSAGTGGCANIGDANATGRVSIPGVSAEFFFPVIGCSMQPEIKAGDVIGVNSITGNRFDPDKIYFILTHEERMIKRLRADDDNEDILWCVSSNYKEFKIYKEDIKCIYQVVFHGELM